MLDPVHQLQALLDRVDHLQHFVQDFECLRVGPINDTLLSQIRLCEVVQAFRGHPKMLNEFHKWHALLSLHGLLLCSVKGVLGQWVLPPMTCTVMSYERARKNKQTCELYICFMFWLDPSQMKGLHIIFHIIFSDKKGHRVRRGKVKFLLWLGQDTRQWAYQSLPASKSLGDVIVKEWSARDYVIYQTHPYSWCSFHLSSGDFFPHRYNRVYHWVGPFEQD